jgi:hypothetical protein
MSRDVPRRTPTTYGTKAIVIHTKQREVRVLETEALLQFLMHLVGVLSIRDLESELHRG